MSDNWGWWVVRDDGDRCAGPFETKDEADQVWRSVYDISEYRVDYQYAVPSTLPQQQRVSDQSELTETIKRTIDRQEQIILLRRVLSEYVAGNRIVDGYWYSPDECGEPHYINQEATADELALVESLRTEIGL